MKWIVAPGMESHGWGFHAEPCEPTDDQRTCQMIDSGQWIKPVDPEMFALWKVAGMPTDLESLKFYGAQKV